MSLYEGGVIPAIRYLRRQLLRPTLGYKVGASFKTISACAEMICLRKSLNVLVLKGVHTCRVT